MNWSQMVYDCVMKPILKKQNTPNPLKQGIVDWFYFQVNIRVLQHLKMLWSFILETWLQKDYFKFKSLLFK